MRYHRLILLFFISLAFCIAQAQNFALKSNLISDITLSPSLGAEVGLAPRWTIDVKAQGNFWTLDHRKWKHWLVQPEARYWFCERFTGHFVGLHAIGGQYNFGNLKGGFNLLGSDLSKLKDRRYQGWGAGAGIAYGYAWPVAKHWNIEAEVGFGWIYTRYNSYTCEDCARKVESNRPHNYVGPTKLAFNIEYLF